MDYKQIIPIFTSETLKNYVAYVMDKPRCQLFKDDNEEKINVTIPSTDIVLSLEIHERYFNNRETINNLRRVTNDDELVIEEVKNTINQVLKFTVSLLKDEYQKEFYSTCSFEFRFCNESYSFVPFYTHPIRFKLLFLNSFIKDYEDTPNLDEYTPEQKIEIKSSVDNARKEIDRIVNKVSEQKVRKKEEEKNIEYEQYNRIYIVLSWK
jgi:hypothetical protein